MAKKADPPAERPTTQAAKPPFRESDLYAPVRDFLLAQGYTVRAEVHHCDVAAVRPGPDGDEELVVVELKRGLTIDLLVQGVKRQRDADLVYLAIPRPLRFWFVRKWRDQLHVLRRLELGLILVDLTKLAAVSADTAACLEVVLDPVPFDRAKSQSQHKRHRIGLLKELKGRSSDANVGGSTGVKLMTAYRERSLVLARSLAAASPQSPVQLRLDATDSKTAAILQQNHYGWFIRVERGKYGLSPAGLLAAGLQSEAAAEASPVYNSTNTSKLP